jgi:hypothetical protein
VERHAVFKEADQRRQARTNYRVGRRAEEILTPRAVLEQLVRRAGPMGKDELWPQKVQNLRQVGMRGDRFEPVAPGRFHFGDEVLRRVDDDAQIDPLIAMLAEPFEHGDNFAIVDGGGARMRQMAITEAGADAAVCQGLRLRASSVLRSALDQLWQVVTPALIASVAA